MKVVKVLVKQNTERILSDYEVRPDPLDQSFLVHDMLIMRPLRSPSSSDLELRYQGASRSMSTIFETAYVIEHKSR